MGLLFRTHSGSVFEAVKRKYRSTQTAWFKCQLLLKAEFANRLDLCGNACVLIASISFHTVFCHILFLFILISEAHVLSHRPSKDAVCGHAPETHGEQLPSIQVGYLMLLAMHLHSNFTHLLKVCMPLQHTKMYLIYLFLGASD